jgi:hypothetical protein
MTLDVRLATHPSEAGSHWYRRDGSQVLEVPKADGSGMTPCTLRHARKLDLARGVTSYLKLVDKPGLTLWRCRQAILSALTLPRGIGEDEEKWMARVERDMEETGKQAAQKGTSIHAAIQGHIGGQPVDARMRSTVDAAMEKLAGLGDGWRSEVGVAHPAGYGTKLDLVNDQALIDFKSKDGDQRTLDDLELYDEHEMQLVAGQTAASAGFDPEGGRLSHMPRALGILFISRTHPGACSLHWMLGTRCERAWGMFTALLAYCHAKDGHRPFQDNG